jgi:hypothetical protein
VGGSSRWKGEEEPDKENANMNGSKNGSKTGSGRTEKERELNSKVHGGRENTERKKSHKRGSKNHESKAIAPQTPKQTQPQPKRCRIVTSHAEKNLKAILIGTTLGVEPNIDIHHRHRHNATLTKKDSLRRSTKTD